MNPPPTIYHFGTEYTLHDVFTNPEELNATIANWKKAGHSTLVKNKCVLYVSTQKTRKY